MNRRKLLTALSAFVGFALLPRHSRSSDRRSLRKVEVVYLVGGGGKVSAITTWRHHVLGGIGDTKDEARDDLIDAIRRFEDQHPETEIVTITGL